MNVRNRIKTILTIAFVTLALMGVSASAVEAVGELGILDVTANGGINPNTGIAWAIGDQYRLAFHTAGKFHADNADASFYNALVTAEATLNPALSGSTWTAMISTVTTNIKANTGTEDQAGGAGIGGAGVPVYAMDGTTCIARNNADIWNNWSNPFDGDNAIRIPVGTGPVPASQNVYYSPFLDQYGLGDSGNVHGVNVWTGTNPGGNTHSTQPVGSTVGTPEGSTGTTQWGSSNPNNPGRVWQRGNSNNTTTELSFYALSELLTIQDADVDPNLPTVDAGDSWIAWSGQAVDLAPVVVNNDTEIPQRTLSFAWSADPADGVVFTPNANIETPSVTITKAGDTGDATVITLTLNVTLENAESVVDTMTIDVYDDSCAASVVVGTAAVFDPSDFNKDCVTDIKDIAIMAAEWLFDYSLTAPLVSP